MININNQTFMTVPVLADRILFVPNILDVWPFMAILVLGDSKYFVPNILDVWLEYELLVGCPKALFTGADNLRLRNRQVYKIPQLAWNQDFIYSINYSSSY